MALRIESEALCRATPRTARKAASAASGVSAAPSFIPHRWVGFVGPRLSAENGHALKGPACACEGWAGAHGAGGVRPPTTEAGHGRPLQFPSGRLPVAGDVMSDFGCPRVPKYCKVIVKLSSHFARCQPGLWRCPMQSHARVKSDPSSGLARTLSGGLWKKGRSCVGAGWNRPRGDLGHGHDA